MILLLSKAHATIAKLARPGLGRLVVPGDCDRVFETAELMPWAADNAAFSNFDERAFVRMLDKIYGLPRCLFVAAPDVVGDAEATAERFERWRSEITDRWLPVALVAQDGLTVETTPWQHLDAIFVGGTTEWKLGEEARAIAKRAQLLGKWTHMGRVNTAQRARWAKAIGCRSFDGSKFSKWTRTYLDDGVGWARAEQQLLLEMAGIVA